MLKFWGFVLLCFIGTIWCSQSLDEANSDSLSTKNIDDEALYQPEKRWRRRRRRRRRRPRQAKRPPPPPPPQKPRDPCPPAYSATVCTRGWNERKKWAGNYQLCTRNLNQFKRLCHKIFCKKHPPGTKRALNGQIVAGFYFDSDALVCGPCRRHCTGYSSLQVVKRLFSKNIPGFIKVCEGYCKPRAKQFETQDPKKLIPLIKKVIELTIKKYPPKQAQRPQPQRPGAQKPQPQRPVAQRPQPQRPGAQKPQPQRPVAQRPQLQQQSFQARPKGRTPVAAKKPPVRPVGNCQVMKFSPSCVIRQCNSQQCTVTTMVGRNWKNFVPARIIKREGMNLVLGNRFYTFICQMNGARSQCTIIDPAKLQG